MTTEVLVKPSTVQERLLGKIREMQQNNLTANQKVEIERCALRAQQRFADLTRAYFGISQVQILNLSDQELEALFLIVSTRAQKTSFYVKIICYPIPMVGWGLISTSDAVIFSNNVRILRRMLGNDFNPVRLIRGLSQIEEGGQKP